MRTLKLTVAYDGTRFVGWQRQAEGDSIQSLIEDALVSLEGARVTVHGSGRTDAGVHALAQVASTRVTFSHDPATVMRALNSQLPADIRITEVSEAPPDFHARFSATCKTYRYLIDNAAVALPFFSRYAWHVPELLDRDAMMCAAVTLIGSHDFAVFQSIGSAAETTRRTMTCSELRERHVEVIGGRHETFLTYEIAGDGFLRHMVRTIVGTLVEVGRGRRPAHSMADLLEGRERGRAGPTAPARGLFLVRVDY